METKTIGYLMPEPTPPPQRVGVVVPVGEWAQFDAKEFIAKYTSDHPRLSDVAEDDLALMAAAFLTLAGSLPMYSDELVRWIAETNGMCLGEGGNAIAEYAEKHLGMEPPEKPTGSRRGRRATRRGREG